MNSSRKSRFLIVLVLVVASAGFVLAQSSSATGAPNRANRTEQALIEPEKGEFAGVSFTGAPSVAQSVESIMALSKDMETLSPYRPGFTRQADRESEFEEPQLINPGAPEVSEWPPADSTVLTSSHGPLAPQPLGVHFKATELFVDSEAIPADTMGDVGATQIVVHVNGRIKVFDKAGNIGALNAADAAFWATVSGGADLTDPQVRYDRLSGKWILMMTTITASNNLILLAVSNTPTITSSSSFNFFSFGFAATGDNGNFSDYPTLGVDANALYIGSNMYTAGPGSFVHSTAFVVKKSSVTSGPGAAFVTAFVNVTNGSSGPGPFSPQGVDNDDPSATEGYFIGSDIVTLSLLQVRRVSTPGGVPTLSGNLSLNTPVTANPIDQPQPAGVQALDSNSRRLFAAAIHKNKITGALSLWSAQHIQVNASGVGNASGGRNGARWYEIRGSASTPAAPLGGTMTLVQSGTLFDSSASNPRGFIYPSVVETGQGHMALGATFASTAASDFPGVAVAGRLRTDLAGSTQAATIVQPGFSTYLALAGTRNRWGDFSHTDVDPNDDMTVWTFQEYCNGSLNETWAIRAVQLLAPPPASPTSASPPSLCANRASTLVTVTGTSSGGSEFFDPGVGYANHLSASATGGITVNGATFTDPTHVTLDLNTSLAAVGAQGIAITNPDAQSANGPGLVTVTVCTPGALQGTVSSATSGLPIGGATVTAGGNSTTTNGSGFYQFPSITDGPYTVAATAAGYTGNSAGTSVVTGLTTTQNLALSPNNSGCLTDTSQADFTAGVGSGVDLAVSPGSVKLAEVGVEAQDQAQSTLTSLISPIDTVFAEAQSFRCSVSGRLTRIDVNLACNNPTGGCAAGSTVPLTVEIRTVTAQNNTAAPTGTILATATIAPFTSGSAIFYTATFSAPPTLTTATFYSYVVHATGGNNTTGNNYEWVLANTNTYLTGSRFDSNDGGATWTVANTTSDFAFKTFMTPIAYSTAANSGTLVSSLKDANPATVNDTPRWTTLSWTATTPGNTSVKFQIAAANTPGGTTNFVGPDGTPATFFTTTGASLSQFNGNRYLKYKAYLSTTNPTVTPSLNDVTVCYENGCFNLANNTPCNDGNACTFTDVCTAGVCGGTTTTPPETQNMAVAADKVTYSWAAATFATRYDVLRGSLAALPVGPGGLGSPDETCFDDLGSTTKVDGDDPGPGNGFWYLSRGENDCGIGTYGTDSNASPRTSTTCP